MSNKRILGASKPEYRARTKELRKIMRDHKLTSVTVAQKLGCSRQAVKRWMSELTIVPERSLRLLKYELNIN